MNKTQNHIASQPKNKERAKPVVTQNPENIRANCQFIPHPSPCPNPSADKNQK